MSVCIQAATVCVPGALAELVSLSFMRGKPYDHLVVECSGIAEPRLVRRLFQDAQAAGPDPACAISTMPACMHAA